MKLINLTPHEINVLCADGSMLSIPASGDIARCKELRTLVGNVNGIDLYHATYGDVYGLPEQEANDTLYIVSMAVRLALHTRKDIVSPGELVRDDAGKPIGCKGFAVN